MVGRSARMTSPVHTGIWRLVLSGASRLSLFYGPPSVLESIYSSFLLSTFSVSSQPREESRPAGLRRTSFT